jgi:tetratricopeptide (TPR) repeat protein
MKSVLAVLLLAVTVASADPQKDAQAAADAGAALFKQDDFIGAAKKFEEAYGLVRDPSYLFNIAQAYRHGGDCVRAADYYGRFLSEIPHPPNEDKVRVWYASQLQCAKEKAATLPVEEPVEPEPPKPEPAKPEPLPPEPPEPEPAKPSGGNGKIIAYTLGGVGVAALAFGGFFAWDAQYLEDQRRDLQKRCTTEQRCDADRINNYDRRGSRANKLMIAGFAVGGAAIAAGVTVYILSRRSSESPAIAIVPLEGGAMVTRGVSF